MNKLLVVDDDEQNLYLLQVLLGAYGYEVMSARNGVEALNLARHAPPDMIVTDILMPAMDGFTLCREWKRDEVLKNIPFVFYTATYTDPKDEKFALSLGAERFIIKPTEPDALVEILREVFKEHEKGQLIAPDEPIKDEQIYIEEYNKTLLRKLEDKVVELEATNSALEREIVERKQTEEALHKSQQKYQLLFDSLLDGYALHKIICDDEGIPIDYRFLDINPAFEQFTGLGRDILGKTVLEVLPRMEPYWIEMYGNVALTGEPIQFENYSQEFGKWFEVVAFKPAAGQFATVFRDITHRKQIEEAEYEQRILAEALRDTAAIINSTLDLDQVLKRILENIERVAPHDGANIMLVEGDIARVVRATGYYVEHNLVDGMMALRFPISQTHNLRQMSETKEPFVINDIQSYVGWVEAPETRWVRSYVGAPICRGPELIGFINLDSAMTQTFVDKHAEQLQAFAYQAAIAIRNAQLYQELETHKEQLEQKVEARTVELHRVKERVETILNNSPDAILLLDRNGSIEMFNRAFYNLFGYDANEVDGKTPAILAAPHCIETLRDVLRTALEENQTMRLEIIAQHKRGSTFDADTVFAPIEDGGVVTGLVCSVRDISVLKEVERMKDAFVSNVSHELRTPITSIKLHHDLLKRNPDRSEIYISRLERETERLANIVEDLLRLSRLDQGQVILDFMSVDLNTMVSRYVSDRVLMAESEGVEISCNKQQDIPLAQADPKLLGQVLGVLLTNAIHYTPVGGKVTVEVQTCELEEESWVGFQVRDTGPGIPFDERARLFERFFRGSVGRESGKAGTGLGLAIAKEIIELHQGRLELVHEGISNQGATFNVWLPTERSRLKGKSSAHEPRPR